MKKFSIRDDKFKIMEYNDYAAIVPQNDKYDICMFFFAGFNENSSKYIYLLKNFFENAQVPSKIKIVIPLLPKYEIKDYPKLFIPNPKDFSYVYAWYSFERIEAPEGPIYNLIPNEKTDNFIKNLVNKEIKKLGESSENIIFSGFSMGGKYLLHILESMKIKTKFNVIFKSIILPYKNIYKNDDSEEGRKYNANEFYFFFSANDKIVTFPFTMKSYYKLRKEFKKVSIKCDNIRKHIVDHNCLLYLQSIFQQYSFASECPQKPQF